MTEPLKKLAMCWKCSEAITQPGGDQGEAVFDGCKACGVIESLDDAQAMCPLIHDDAPTPEHDQLRSLTTEQRVVQEFLDWMDEDTEAHPQAVKDEDSEMVHQIPKSWQIAFRPTIAHSDTDSWLYPEDEWEVSEELFAVNHTKAEIIGLFLGVDPVKLEGEKRAMLTRLQHQNDKEHKRGPGNY